MKPSDYQPSAIEPKWQDFWANEKTFAGINPKPDAKLGEKFYVLDMFPYPSGAGLHIGHPEGYTATDALKRMKKAQGFNVLHPMGWDAFGLPTEQYAIKTGEPPAKVTKQNIENFKKQLAQIGLTYDWEREVNTTDPGYFKWTQWIFVQLFQHGLAYVDEKPVWYCPELGTVLANEEVLNTPEGPRSERGSFPVERRPLRQWVLRITAYADKLLDGLKTVDWPDSTKRLQANWIGKSTGAEVDFELDGYPGKKLRVFTTRPDTLYGATYMVVAPEHPFVAEITTDAQRAEVEAYVEKAKSKSDLERAELAKEKTGVPTGAYAINPVNGEKIPVWVADYVLITYGTGAIMAVPAHDERDFEFAKTFGLEIKQVIFPQNCDINEAAKALNDARRDHGSAYSSHLVVEGFSRPSGSSFTFSHRKPFTDEGCLGNSGSLDGLSTDEAKKKITSELQSKGVGKEAVNYKLRDWLFSRQRYWGEPFPILWVSPADFERLKAEERTDLNRYLPVDPVTSQIDGEDKIAVALPMHFLPLTLPEVETYQPTGTGESPLAKSAEWVNVWLDMKSGKTQPRVIEEGGEDRLTERPGADWIEATRETNTMPQWAGSCWYYLRYVDSKNPDLLIDPALEEYWGGPDLYVGGAEHAVLHLLYARFWHLFLKDIGVLKTNEPFKKLFHQGIILGEDGEKMSKSRGNVVNPEVVIDEHGADALRLYLMFLGPLEAMKPWDPKGIQGIVRFLRKAWREFIGENGEPSAKLCDAENDADTARALHETIKKVSADYERLSFNTAISQMMICLNQFGKAKSINRESAKAFVQLLAPLAPHIAEELWERLGGAPSVANAPWPKHDESKLVQDTVKLMVQINGKLRGELETAKDAPKDEVLAAAKALEKVQPHLEGKNLVKEIYVPGRIVNLVVK